MNQIKFKFTKSKLIIIVILLITFGVTYFVYEDTYNLTAASDKLSPAINDYIYSSNVKAELQFIHKDNGWMYVVFSDNQYGNNFKGMVRLKRGWNGKYVIYDANYGTGYPVSQYLFRDNNSKFAIYGFLPDARAKHFEYINNGAFSKEKVVYSGDITQKAFVQVYNKANIDLLSLKLYDSAGCDITESYSIESINNAPTAGVSTAELFMVDFLCGFIIFLGFLLAFVLWFKRPLHS